MWDIFKDDNKWNEKSIVGFCAFLIMVVVMLTDVITGAFGKDFAPILANSFIIGLSPKFELTTSIELKFIMLSIGQRQNE